jgi:cholesterol transport system auxiliary component
MSFRGMRAGAGADAAIKDAAIKKEYQGMTAPTGLKAAPLAALAFALAGCVNLGGGDPPATLLNLTPASAPAAGAATTGSMANALVIAEPETDQRLAVQRVPVQVDAASVAYLQDAQWVERPARLFRALLAETIRARSARLVVEDNQIQAGSGTRLAGRLLDMGYDAGRSAVIVRYDAILEGQGTTVRTRRFEAVVPGIEPKAEFVGPALNQAANQVAQQVAEWVG